METNSKQTIFDRLKTETGDLWATAQDHPFVHGLANGSLPREKFIHYLKQDYAYLIGFSRAIAIATAKAPDLRLMAKFSALLNETLNTEMQLHRDYCGEYGISEPELAAVEPAPICQAYIDFCIATAATSDCLDLLAALIPCGVGYAEIGTHLNAHITNLPDHPYAKWIETYASAEYLQYTDWMVATLNELGEGMSASRLNELARLFKLGCRYEWQFWEMAWKEDSWPV